MDFAIRTAAGADTAWTTSISDIISREHNLCLGEELGHRRNRMRLDRLSRARIWRNRRSGAI